MPLVIADRVLETTTTTGTGTITLAGAEIGYQSFSVVGNGNTTYYTIAVTGGTDWEVGIGTYTASGTTLSRDTVLASSNSGSLVSFGSGTKNVFVTYPGARAVYYQAAGGVVVTDNSSNDALRITQTGAGNALLVEDSANPDSTPFVVTATGSVGIGTTTPATALDVRGDICAGPDTVGRAVLSQGSATDSGFVSLWNADLSVRQGYFGFATLAGNGVLDIWSQTTGNALRFGTNNTERMRIASTGAIGLSGANYGTSGQTLTSRGSSSTPVWSNPGIISALVFGL